jgi:UDP-3-O-[3-hydroxymyristoyl] glucosamine N-acyltransferase
VAELLLSQLCGVLTGHGFAAQLEGEDRRVRAVNTIEDAGPGEITFLSNPKYVEAAQATRASAIIAAPGVDLPGGLSVVRCKDPYAAVTVSIVAIHGYRRHPAWGVSERATVHPSAKIGPGANIAPGATVCEEATIGENVTLYPGSFVGPRARLGNDCTLYPNVVVYDDCEIGSRVTLHAGTVVGQDGLGYAPVEGKWLKIPQVGRTIIGDDVEVGANCAIDRATLGRTVVAAGTKFGNVIVIGHGSKVGEDCLFVGLVGIAGSVTIGRHCTFGGQTGTVGHVTIGDDVSVAAQSGVSHDIPDGQQLLGSPALPLAIGRRVAVAQERLPEMLKRLRELEREVEALKKSLAQA